MDEVYRGPGSVYMICKQMGISEYSTGAGKIHVTGKESLQSRYKKYMDYLAKNPPMKKNRVISDE